MSIVLVTGASGFIGQRVCSVFVARGYTVSAVVRSGLWHPQSPAGTLRMFAVGGMNASTEWAETLEGVDSVIHCAARAHVIKETARNPLEEFRMVNVGGTIRLAEQCVSAGVRRFIFLSSIGVLGTNTNSRGPFSASDIPAPAEDYALSKLEAEEGLRELARTSSMEVVIVRPPLVYGRGVKGNFARLLQLLERGIPLPLSAVENRRSLVGIDNLVDLLLRCVEHPRAAGEVFLVSDGEDLSVSSLLQRMARMMGRSPRLFPVPVSLLRLAGAVTGRQVEVDRLVGSLQVDITRTRELLDWNPPLTVDEGLRRMFQNTGGST